MNLFARDKTISNISNELLFLSYNLISIFMIYYYISLRKYFFSVKFLLKKRILILVVNCLLNYSLNAQVHHLSINIGGALTSRILLDNNALSSNEMQFAKKLEVLKPTYDFSIGYIGFKNNKIQYEIGFSHRWLRFGSRIYRVDSVAFNPTPQYPKVKKIVQQNQFSGYFKYLFNLHKIRNVLFFIQTDAVFNYQNYLIRSRSYDEKNEVGIVAKGSGDTFKFHLFDMKISLGGVFPIWQRKDKKRIMLNYYFGGYIQPYNVFGKGIGGYLIFDKNTSGLVWDLGIRLQYRIF